MNKYFKLILTLGIAYIIADFSINNVFLAKSPKLNPFFVQNIASKINNSLSNTKNFVASINYFTKSKPEPSNFSNNSNSINNQLPSIEAQNNTFAVKTLDNAPKEIVDALTAPLSKVSQGVYAGEKNNIKVYEIRTNEIDYLEYTFNVRGKEIKIKVPKDQKPPSQDVVEALYQ